MQRPYIVINCAISADGKIALPTKKQLQLSSDQDIERMYKLRNENDAVLVGINTILSDNPKLTVKEKYIKHPRQPIRIILDTNCKTPKTALAVDKSTKTIIVTAKECSKNYGDNVKILTCKTDKNGLIELNHLLELLYAQGIKTLMIEGGGTVIWNFLHQQLVDDLYVYISPMIIGGKNTPTLADGEGIKNIEKVISLKIIGITRLGPGLLIHYKLIK